MSLTLLAALAALGIAYSGFGLDQYATLEFLKSRQHAFQACYDAHPWQAVTIFFGLYVLVAGASLPGAAILTLAAGALFGLAFGTVVVSFASTIGATRVS